MRTAPFSKKLIAFPLYSLSPHLRGEGWGEGLLPHIRLAEGPPHPALRADLSPQAGRGQSHRPPFQTTSAAAYGSRRSPGRRGERVCVRDLAAWFRPRCSKFVGPLQTRGRRESRVPT